jgi:5'-AMP-activated protein kinase catalytic alpha subunit
MASEIVSGILYAGSAVDIWSCGVILYALLCGKLPFDEKSLDSLYAKIKSQDYSFPPDVILSDKVKDLIKKMLVVDLARRF